MILGLIPARGGSKEIPRKNIKMIAGKPLIAWTIEAARASNLLDDFVVSTEDAEIAEISRQYGAKVLERPPELATDEADTLDVMQHALTVVDASTLVLLQCTSPFRTDGLIDQCIQEFLEQDFDSLATGFICKYKEYGRNELRRQDIEGFFYDDGNVYVNKAELVRKGDRFGGKIGRKCISRWENAEIDDAFDFWLLEQILLQRTVR